MNDVIDGLSVPHADERNGAQVFVARCIDPATNTPGAQKRINNFIEPHMRAAGIRIDVGNKDRDRWLLDRVQSAGLVRQYEQGDPITTPWLEERNLNLAIDAHGPEVVVFMDHTDCGERNLHWYKTNGRYPSPEEETLNIRDSLRGAEHRFRQWEVRHRGVDAPPVLVILAVGLVTPVKAACRRRLNGIVMLSEYIDLAQEAHHMGPKSRLLTLTAVAR